MKKIGIVRTLWYYDEYPQWDVFFRNLGLEVVVSKETTRAMLDYGLSTAEEETCLPVKIAFGHLLDLKEKQVDFIFLPYLVSRYKNYYQCPNFAALPDMVKNTMAGLPKIISPIIDANKKSMRWILWELGLRFSCNLLKINQAVNKVLAVPPKERIPSADEKHLKVALIGHAYITEDRFINMDIIKKLEGFGVQVCLAPSGSKDVKSLNWKFIQKLHAGLVNLLQEKMDGVISLSCFGCGPDSLAGEVFRDEARRFKVPFLELVIDEHTSPAAFDTRLEAFCDVLERKKT